MCCCVCRLNDVVFSVHACVCGLAFLVQVSLPRKQIMPASLPFTAQCSAPQHFIPLQLHYSNVAVLAQIAAYDRGSQALSRTCQRVVAALLLGIGGAMGASMHKAVPLEPLDFLYLLSYIKVGITLMKYTPQVRPFRASGFRH